MPKTDILNAEVLKNRLDGDIEVFYYPSVDSTNNQAKRLIDEGNRNTLLVVAGEQTSGRGRQGKSFYSPANTGIYMSFAFHPMRDVESIVSSTTAASVAVCRAIEKLTDKRPEIKWVNDVYLGGKKICGILCEALSNPDTQQASSLIIGIGVNISTRCFPQDVENATSLETEIERADLISEITRQLQKIVLKDYSDFIEYYRAHSMIIGKEIVFIQNGKTTRAKALEIENDGGLKVQLNSGETMTLRSGEISIRRV